MTIFLSFIFFPGMINILAKGINTKRLGIIFLNYRDKVIAKYITIEMGILTNLYFLGDQY